MKTYNEWMDEYEESHHHPTNQLLHKICVPAILLTVIGFFWMLPTPAMFDKFPYLNWGTLFVLYCLVIYLFLNRWMFLGMLVQMAIMLGIVAVLEKTGILLPFSVLIFTVAWIGQFYGHKIEGKKPSFFKDILFLLIGPLWVTRFLYRKFGFQV